MECHGRDLDCVLKDTADKPVHRANAVIVCESRNEGLDQRKEHDTERKGILMGSLSEKQGIWGWNRCGHQREGERERENVQSMVNSDTVKSTVHIFTGTPGGRIKGKSLR